MPACKVPARYAKIPPLATPHSCEKPERNHAVTKYPFSSPQAHVILDTYFMEDRLQGAWKAQRVFVKSPAADLARIHELPTAHKASTRLLVGRHEWIGLPLLGERPWIAKTDTGARTSTLHATGIHVDAAANMVHFRTIDGEGCAIDCQAPLSRYKCIRNSTGNAQNRVIITTTARFAGGLSFPIELTLADRSHMKCPVLLGRRAMAGYFLVDPQSDYLLGDLHDFFITSPSLLP